MFDEILADCLEALAKGATIRDCLTRYPAEAATLEPLLRLAVELGREGETRLSPGAFSQGRRQLMRAAQARQAPEQPKGAIRHRQLRYTRPATPAATPSRRTPFPPYQQNGRPLPPRPVSVKPAQWQVQLPRLLRMALVLLAVVSATTFFRQVTTSLPGTWLYPVKSGSERMMDILMTAAGEAGIAAPTPVETVTAVVVTATVATPISTPTMTPTITPTASATAMPTETPTPLLQPSATALGAPILAPSPTALPPLTPTTVVPVVPSPTIPPTPLPEITIQIPRQESSEPEEDAQQKDEEASGAGAPMATATPLTPEALPIGVETGTPVIGTGPAEETPTPAVLLTEAVTTPTAPDQTPTVTSGEGVWPLPTNAIAPAPATSEPAVTTTVRPTNQPNATKTPKATATQGNAEPATPNAPTVAPLTTTAPPTPVEKTPNATTLSPVTTKEVAIKEVATETPVAVSPTPRPTTSGGDATKTPQP